MESLQKPYRGKNPYIFISYSHRDCFEAFGIIGSLQSAGYRLWYDEGIDPGTEWDDFIAEHIEACGYFVALISQNYLDSSNCKDELNYARELEKPRLLVYLEKVQLPGGMKMRLSRLQAVYMYSYADKCRFLEKLYETKGLKICLINEGDGEVRKDSDSVTEKFKRHQIKEQNNVLLEINPNEDASDQLQTETPGNLGLLTASGDKAEDFDLETELSKIIGLEPLKQYIRSLNAKLKLQAEQKKAGLKIDTMQTLHMIFVGNPGTGKTMMAKTVAKILYNMNAIQTDKLIMANRSDLVADYVGQTAIKTRTVIKSALGGVLFIDEAHTLARGRDNSFDREAIDTLIEMMSDNKNQLVVILAGYSEGMKLFLDMNVGIRSRFANIIEFPDYSTDELMKIADSLYSEKGYILSPAGKEALRAKIENARKNEPFENCRYVRNVFDRSLNHQIKRLSSNPECAKEGLVIITEDDVNDAYIENAADSHMTNQDLFSKAKTLFLNLRYSESYELLEYLMTRGYVPAYGIASYCNFLGLDRVRNIEEAYRLAKEKIESKNPYALYVMGECYLTKEFEKYNPKVGQEYLNEAYQQQLTYGYGLWDNLGYTIFKRIQEIEQEVRERNHVAVRDFHV